MKCLFALLLSTLIIISMTFIKSVKLNLKSTADKKAAADEDVISDKELDQLLKDPKYAAIAGDLALPVDAKSPAAAVSEPAADKTASSHYMSNSYKDHLDRVGGKKGKSESNTKSPKEDLESIDLLSKSLSTETLKDIELLNPPKKEEDKPNETKKTEVIEEKFKNFDFISKQQARYLIEVLKQPVFFNMLPSDAQQIVKVVNDNFSFKFEENNKLNDFLEINLVNSPNSQTFIDPDGIIGRKGILTLIDPENGGSKYVWAVSNAKVLTFFQSQSLLTIVKLYRNSSLILKDIGATPCFLLSSLKDLKDGSILTCATSVQEKEVWTQTIKSHQNNN